METNNKEQRKKNEKQFAGVKKKKKRVESRNRVSAKERKRK